MQQFVDQKIAVIFTASVRTCNTAK